MAVLRIHKKQQNFVILDKTCLNDGALSWGAKGLHAYLISLPDNWQVRVSDLKERAKNGRDAVRALLCELEQAGYIQKANRRNDANGRFGGIEYLVLELPEREAQDILPEPESPSPVRIAQKEQTSPRPENPFPVTPATGNPAPVTTTLININRINNNKPSNKTATANVSAHPNATGVSAQPEAAAVIFFDSGKPLKTLRDTEIAPINFLPEEDALIGLQLTCSQKQRVSTMLKRLNLSKSESLVEEVEFCLLSSKHFTGCAKDFSRKLNAIRGVILRGDWQTPAEMLQERLAGKCASNSVERQLKEELTEARAEVVHFKRLLSTAKEHSRAHFEEIINQTQKKIHVLEGRIRGILSQPQEVPC